MQTAGSMESIGWSSKSPAPGAGAMQLTGQAETQVASLQQFCVMT
jgi:hypothetical protein